MILLRGNVEKEVKNAYDIEKLKKEGFKEISPTEQKESDAVKEKEINEMNLKELKEYATNKGISGASSLSKEQLLEVLKEMI